MRRPFRMTYSVAITQRPRSGTAPTAFSAVMMVVHIFVAIGRLS